MFNRRYLISAIIVFFPTVVFAIQNQTFTYDALIDGKHQPVKLSVEHSQNQTTVHFFNQFGDTETSVFTDQTRQLASRYTDTNGRKTAEAIYNYTDNTITVNGDYPAKHPYKEPTFDNNGAIFYLFSIIQPDATRKITFNLCPSSLRYVTDPFLRNIVKNLVGPVEMYIKYLKDEDVLIKETTYQTRKFELGINAPALALFWPNKYYLWYSVDDHVMIKFEGYNANSHCDVYYLQSISTEDIPSPELPSL